MRAKIKATGEVIDLVAYDSTGKYVTFINHDGQEETRPLYYYEDIEYIPESSFDWDTFRNETAAKILTALLSNSRNEDSYSISVNIINAINVSDMLIEELKKPKQ